MSLPSSMADFVPCDRLLQKAYLAVSKPFVLSFTRASLFRANAFLINHSVCFGNA